MNRDNLIYRHCVGIAMFNKHGKIFVGERIDTPGAWQMPQGGIDKGEDIKTAAMRELQEEAGINNAEIICISSRTTRYELPDHLIKKLWNGKFRGQEQSWVAMRFLGNDNDINLNAHTPPEFSKWQWIAPSQMLDLIVPFKRETYVKVIEMFANIKY